MLAMVCTDFALLLLLAYTRLVLALARAVLGCARAMLATVCTDFVTPIQKRSLAFEDQ